MPPISRLTAEHGYPVVGEAGVEPFLAGGGDRALFFTGDPGRRPESADLAVILPSLIEAFDGRFTIAVVDRKDETALKARFGVVVVPTLVFLRDGGFVGVIPRLRDWQDYLRRIADLLEAPSGPLPGNHSTGRAQ
jgi:hydrogenase-1 operon protein HyaE